MRAYLILEDGTVFEGKSMGSTKDVICEVVFNTAMTGYEEALTDPSYAGQGITMTYPLIGNYGVNSEDVESGEPFVKAFIVRELARRDSNFRSEGTLGNFLEKYNITGIEGIDTREITKRLRESGTMNGFITTNPNFDKAEVLKKLKEYKIGDVVSKVSTKKAFELGDPKNPMVAIIDFGSKNNIARLLVNRGLSVKVYPHNITAEEIIKDNPNGIMLSNGPGDPKECIDIIGNIKKLYETEIPIFAICLGHQLMALATGADTKKLKYGHRGGNHPVLDKETGRVYITSQNHSYVVDETTVDEKVAEVSHINVNDKTVEGLKYVGKNIFSVQFHPEASPGPMDTNFIFDKFLEMIGGNKNA